MHNVLLRGYFGHGNWGDEILLRALVAGLKTSGISQDRLHYWRGNDRSFQAAAIGHSTPRGLKGMMAWARAGAMVFCGGIFYDHLPHLNIQRLRRIYLLASIARALGKKVVMFGVSIGPLISIQGRQLTYKILKFANAIWVRDRQSYRFCQAAGLPCRQIPDLSALLYSDIAAIPTSADKREVLFIPCQTGMPYRAHVKILDALISVVRHYGWVIRLMPIHVSGDTVLAGRLAEQQGVELAADLSRDPMDLFARIKEAKFVVSTRLHGGWAAYLAGCPFVQINYHDKCRGFAETIHLPGECLIDPFADTIDLKNGVDRWFAPEGDLHDELRSPKILEEQVTHAVASAAKQML